ncbi:MAG: MazG nucleotide pyrophosphohydrolase domain-containing protein, partial [Nitrospirales bacterium]
ALHQGEASSSSASSASAHVDGEPRTRIEEEFGDVLFSLVNLARFLKINPEEALRRATNRFTARFHYLEAQAKEAGRNLADMSLEEMDALWEAAKQQPSSVPERPHPPHHH